MDQVYYFMRDDIGDLFIAISFLLPLLIEMASGREERSGKKMENRQRQNEKTTGILISRLCVKYGMKRISQKVMGDKLENFQQEI